MSKEDQMWAEMERLRQQQQQNSSDTTWPATPPTESASLESGGYREHSPGSESGFGPGNGTSPGTGPLYSLVNRLAVKDRERRERLELFLAGLPAELKKPRQCRGEGEGECDGWVYKWFGPHDLTDPLAGWKAYPCGECSKGQTRQVEVEVEEVAKAREDRKKVLLERSQLPQTGIFEGVTVAGYLKTDNGAEKWVQALAAWVYAWPNQTGPGLVLAGSYGVGKTGLAIAIGKALIERHLARVYFITVREFVDAIGQAWRLKDGSEFDLFDRMDNTDLLILDDLGAGHGRAKDWDDNTPISALFTRLDKRYKERKPVIITTNADGPGQFCEYVGERNMNRIWDMCKFVDCRGKNLRGGLLADNGKWDLWNQEA